MSELQDVIETTEEEVTAEDGSSLAEELWYSDDDSEMVDDDDTEENEVDQPSDEGEEEPEEEEPADGVEAEPVEDTDQYLELKHLDETKKVSKDEAKVLAQKGLDYDRIREERDRLKSDTGKLKQYEDFLNELKGDFDSIDDLMDDTRARLLADKEGIEYEQAMNRIKSQKQKAPEKAEPTEEERRANAVSAFVDRYPNVRGEDIPQSVWDRTRTNGGDLVGAYSEWESAQQAERIKALENEIEILKQNEKNRGRSTGSSKSSGTSKTKTLVDELWNDGF